VKQILQYSVNAGGDSCSMFLVLHPIAYNCYHIYMTCNKFIRLLVH